MSEEEQVEESRRIARIPGIPEGYYFQRIKPAPQDDVRAQEAMVVQKRIGSMPSPVKPHRRGLEPGPRGNLYEITETGELTRTPPYQPRRNVSFMDVVENYPNLGVPIAAMIPAYSEPREPTVQERVGSFTRGIQETWSEPGAQPEHIASSLIFRNLWDPAYAKRLQEEYATWGKTHDIQQVRAQQQEQVQFGVSLALIAYTAYDIGRAVYQTHKVAKPIGESLYQREQIRQQLYGDVEKLPVSPEPTKEFAQQIYEPTATKPQPEKWFVQIRGSASTPMSKTLERVISRGEPLGGLAATEQLVGELPASKWEPMFPLTQVKMGSPILPQPPQFMTPLLLPSALSFFTKRESSIRQGLKPLQGAMTRQGAMTQQIAGIAQIQRTQQTQRQRMIAPPIPILRPPPTPSITPSPKPFQLPKFETQGFGKAFKLRKGAWFLKIHPIPTAQQVGVKFGMGGGKKRRWV